MVLSTKLVEGRACGLHLRRSTRRGWTQIVYYTSVELHYFDLFWICCTTYSYSYAAVNQISTDTARRVVRLRYKG